MPLQYGELRTLAAEIVLLVWSTQANFNGFRRLSRLGSLTARHFSSGRQSNCGVG